MNKKNFKSPVLSKNKNFYTTVGVVAVSIILISGFFYALMGTSSVPSNLVQDSGYQPIDEGYAAESVYETVPYPESGVVQDIISPE